MRIKGKELPGYEDMIVESHPVLCLPTAYIAASFPMRDEAIRLQEYLRGIIAVNSRWLEDTHTNYGGGNDSFFAEQDLQDVEEAQMLICISDGKKQLTRGGRHTEFGIALAMKKPIILIGPREQIFHHHPRVIHCDEVTSMLRGEWQRIAQALYLTKNCGAVLV